MYRGTLADGLSYAWLIIAAPYGATSILISLKRSAPEQLDRTLIISLVSQHPRETIVSLVLA